MTEKPAVALRYEAGRYLVVAEFAEWPAAVALFNDLAGIEPDRPFLGEELGTEDDVSPFMADLEPCPEDCQEHRIHVRGEQGLYPLTPGAAGMYSATVPVPLTPGRPVIDPTAGAVAFGISEPECPE